MLKDLIRDWLKEWHATNATRLKRGELEQQTHEIAEWKLFYSLHFLSQEKHGLPFALINNLAINGGQVDDVETQVSDPNDLLYYAIASTQAAISDIATNNEIFALREAIVVWEEKLQACKERLKIADSNPSLTALRPR
jgi:hypothetical protein